MEEDFDNLKESLKNSEEENKIYEINWKLKEICKKLKKKYHILDNWSKEEQSDKIDHYHFFEIFYYECCLEMLKNKFSPPKIDYRHYLIVAELEYSYFIEKGKEFNKIFEKFQKWNELKFIHVIIIEISFFNTRS